MSTKSRFFTVKTDVGILPAGIKALDCPSGNCPKGKGVTYPAEARADMFVFYTNSDQISIDPSSTPTTPNVVMGQYKANGNGVITEILKIIGDKITACDLLSLRAVAAQVGRPQISRWMYSCSKKDTYYGLNVDITSNRTRLEFAMDQNARYVMGYDTSIEPGCDNCDDPTTCRVIACRMIDTFNGNLPGDGGFVPYIEEPKPVRAFYYNPTNLKFCLDGSQSSCGGCENFTGIKGVSIQGRDVLFSDTLNSTTTSHASQLKRLTEQITCAFSPHQGTAWIGGGTISGACTSIELIINTCMGVKLIKADGSYLDQCDSETVSFTKTSTRPCVGCPDSNLISTTYDCAIGFIGELAEENCNCEGKGDNPVRYYTTEVSVSSSGGFIDGVFDVVVEAVSPEGFGVQLWETAYRGDIRPGYLDHNRRTGGEFNALFDKARQRGVELVCNLPYCVIAWSANAYGQFVDDIGFHGRTVVENYVAIPMSFDTKEALVADLNALKNADNIRGIVDIACTVDPDPGPPSPSVTPSAYATPSVTPTVSKTPSVTPSISISKSTSVTGSITLSVSKTPSLTVSITVSKSVTPSTSV